MQPTKNKRQPNNIIIPDGYAQGFTQKSDTMYLSTIKNKETGFGPFKGPKRELLSLTTADIDGATPTPFYADLLVKDFDSRRQEIFISFKISLGFHLGGGQVPF